MLASTPGVERRFGLLRLYAYVLRAFALLGLFASGIAILAFGLTLFQLPAFAQVALPFGLTTALFALLGALALAAVAELYLVLLAIEENTRAAASAAHAAAQAQQQQTEMAAALATIAQNSRFAADDLLKAGKLLELMADEQRRGQGAVAGLSNQLKELADQGQKDSARLAVIEAVARAFAQRLLGPPPGGSPTP